MVVKQLSSLFCQAHKSGELSYRNDLERLSAHHFKTNTGLSAEDLMQLDLANLVDLPDNPSALTPIKCLLSGCSSPNFDNTLNRIILCSSSWDFAAIKEKAGIYASSLWNPGQLNITFKWKVDVVDASVRPITQVIEICNKLLGEELQNSEARLNFIRSL